MKLLSQASLFFLFLIFGGGHVFAQCIDDTCGLVISGKVTDIELEKTKDSHFFHVNLNVKFFNKGNKPIILFKPEHEGKYWLGGWTLFASSEPKAKAVFGDGYWQSVSGGQEYKTMADELDVKSPPEKLTKILKPGESWEFSDSFRIYFESEIHVRYPQKRTWKEMQEFPSRLWLSIAYELTPWNVEYFKPHLIKKLKKRWKPLGNVLVDSKNEDRYDLYRVDSQLMEIDFNKAKIRETRVEGK